jgi:Protein of unknown function (DUF2695)
MTTSEIQEKLYELIKPTYPDIIIKVEDSSENIRKLFFTDDKFTALYPKQRYHYLIHLIPSDFFEDNLQDAEWFELAPGERPENLDYHDEETIKEIKDTILPILRDKVPFVSLLDGEFMTQSTKCFGDFRHSKKLLIGLGFSEDDQFDIFHVLMNEGAFCDCEILYNVFREGEYSKKHWQDKEE